MADPAGREAALKKAADALRAGRIAEAEPAIDRLVTEDPSDPDALNLRVALRAGQGRYWAALPDAERAAALRPDDERLALNHAAMLVNTGQLLAALEVFDRVIAARPNDVRARHDRGRTLTEAGRPDDAIVDLTLASRIAPMLTAVKIALAEAQLAAGDASAALRTVADVQKLGEESADTRYLHGRIIAELGSWDRAAELFGLAVAANPDLLGAYTASAYAERERGDLEAARAATDALLTRAPLGRRGEAGATAVLVLERLGDGVLADLRPSLAPHAASNFIAQMPTAAFAYRHAFIDHETSRAAAEAALEEIALVYNNWANADAPPPPETLSALLTRADAPPVINAPAAVADTSRAANAARYQSAAGFEFPGTLSLPAQTLGAPTPLDARLERARAAGPFPLILRPSAGQRGAGATVVSDEDALVAALRGFAGVDLYAIAYHDCSAEDGVFRRYRMSVVDGRMRAANMHVAAQWNVHGSERGDFDWEGDGLRAEELAFVEDPASLLGDAPETVFADIREACRLDVYGIDFGLRRADRRPIVFEVNAAMSFTSRQLVRAFPHLGPSRAALIDDLETLFRARAR